MLKITDKIIIQDCDLTFTASRSSGPGGQNVNKVSTRITVLLDVNNSICFSDKQKMQILERLATRTNKNGVLRVVSQRYRTQKANREAAIERLVELLRNALKKQPVRRKTKVPGRIKRHRLEEKKRRSILKIERKKCEE
ncbi:MAG: aminoacyl-tRNA hydrolase [Candidatus Latescibacteria bacterium]|nr:aminoacyl-tRNA hydrolase [Candidatus Latescibacterota bacterium]